VFKSSTLAIRTSLRRFARDDRGTTAIEYALIASGISIAIAAAVLILGSTVLGFFNSVATALK
jgi:pilus assembly protein Flp/PilA